MFDAGQTKICQSDEKDVAIKYFAKSA